MVCSLLLNSLFSFERFVPCSETVEFFSRGLIFQSLSMFPSLFRAVCSFCLCGLFDILQSISSGLLLLLKLPSSCRTVCSLFSISLVSFEILFFSSDLPLLLNFFLFLSSGLLLFYISIISFDRLAPCSEFL